MQRENEGKNSPVFKWDLAFLRDLLKDEPCPCAVLDLDAFDHNVVEFAKGIEGTGKSLRIGTKSVRVPGLIKRALESPAFRGAFLFHPNELKFLQEKCGIKDFIIAYPLVTSIESLACAEAVARDPSTTVRVMVDSVKHLEVLETAASKHDVILGVLVDVDMGFKFLGQFAGVYRSPLSTPGEVVELASRVSKYPHLRFDGIMGYEAQEAGTGDDSFLFRWMKRESRRLVSARRAAVVEALEAAGLPCEIVNGGGSGCFKDTARERVVTEVTVGSGLFKSYIFDSIKTLSTFQPALFMMLRVVRQPRRNIVTAYSGGFTCSAINKPPVIVAPASCSTISREGFGEVQTPIKFDQERVSLKPGDLVACRFAKAGEPLERFNHVVVISDGEVVDRMPTYRGEGLWLG